MIYWWSRIKLFDQYLSVFDFVQKEHQPNTIYCEMMEHERWQSILQLAILLNASANWWKLHSFTSALWLFTLMRDDFFLDATTNLKQREIFLVEPVSRLLKLVCTLKHLSCKQFHIIVKGDSTFLRNLKKLQNIHELTRTSKYGFYFVCFDWSIVYAGHLTSMLKTYQ